MKYRIFASAFLMVVLTVSMAAQGWPGTGGVPSNPGSPNLNLPTNLPPSSEQEHPAFKQRGPVFLSGKVVVDDGTPLTDAALIQSVCKGQIRAEGYTDRNGAFSVDLNSSAHRQMLGSAEEDDSGIPAALASGPNAGMPRRDMRECDLRAVLPGFISQSIDLASTVNDFGNADVGVIVLHRMKQVEGFTISATSTMAPRKATKEYEQGREAEKKGKWSAAQAKFAKAVEAYPKYAVAWLELGRTQLQLNDPASAKVSFQQSLAVDSKFISPYEELAQLALQEKQWKELADRTGQVLMLNAMSFPHYYYYNALANYYLQSFDQAEKSAAQGLMIDVQHRIPKLEYLLGIILVQKPDYTGAAAHIRNYIRLLPNADDLAIAQKQIAELDRLSAGENLRAFHRLDTQAGHEPVAGFSPDPMVALDGAAYKLSLTPRSSACMPGWFTDNTGALHEGKPVGCEFADTEESKSLEPTPPPPTRTAHGAGTPLPMATARNWAPPDVDQRVPPVGRDASCPLNSVLTEASKHAEELVENLQRFSARERIEHIEFGKKGKRRYSQSGVFNYVAQIERNPSGSLRVEEYREGSLESPPTPLEDMGTAAFALIFHPWYVANFEFQCEGLTDLQGVPAWQVHLQEAPDRTKPFHAMRIRGAVYPLRFKGRAWIAAENQEVLRLETDLVAPTPEIELQVEHLEIAYAPVEFKKRNLQLWLPESATLYVGYRGHRYERVHNFSKFQLFWIDTRQTVKEPTTGRGGGNKLAAVDCPSCGPEAK